MTPATGGATGTLLEGEILAPGIIYHGGQVAVSTRPARSPASAAVLQRRRLAGRDQGQLSDRRRFSPGLINTHDHITYAQNSPYTDTGERYEARNDWRKGLRGHTKLNVPGGATADEIRWGELRFLMGGATSTVGSGGQLGILRNLDESHRRGGARPTRRSTSTPSRSATPTAPS